MALNASEPLRRASGSHVSGSFSLPRSAGGCGRPLRGRSVRRYGPPVLSRTARATLGTAALAGLATAGCGTRAETARTLPFATVSAPPSQSAEAPAPAPGSAGELRAVARVVRHWFARYERRYAQLVRVETLVPRLDTPTQADAYVVVTFTDRQPTGARRRGIVGRPREGRYYRSVQLRLRAGHWHIESVRPT